MELRNPVKLIMSLWS